MLMQGEAARCAGLHKTAADVSNVADHHPAAPWTGRAAAHSSSHIYMTPCATAADGSQEAGGAAAGLLGGA